MTKPINILLVDDHPVVRAGYRRLLETTPDMQVVAEAADGETGYQLYQAYQPDIVIVMFNPNQIGYKDSEQFQFGISEIDSTQLTK